MEVEDLVSQEEEADVDDVGHLPKGGKKGWVHLPWEEGDYRKHVQGNHAWEPWGKGGKGKGKGKYGQKGKGDGKSKGQQKGKVKGKGWGGGFSGAPWHQNSGASSAGKGKGAASAWHGSSSSSSGVDGPENVFPSCAIGYV